LNFYFFAYFRLSNTGCVSNHHKNFVLNLDKRHAKKERKISGGEKDFKEKAAIKFEKNPRKSTRGKETNIRR